MATSPDVPLSPLCTGPDGQYADIPGWRALIRLLVPDQPDELVLKLVWMISKHLGVNTKHATALVAFGLIVGMFSVRVTMLDNPDLLEELRSTLREWIDAVSNPQTPIASISQFLEEDQDTILDRIISLNGIEMPVSREAQIESVHIHMTPNEIDLYGLHIEAVNFIESMKLLADTVLMDAGEDDDLADEDPSLESYSEFIRHVVTHYPVYTPEIPQHVATIRGFVHAVDIEGAAGFATVESVVGVLDVGGVVQIASDKAAPYATEDLEGQSERQLGVMEANRMEGVALVLLAIWYRSDPTWAGKASLDPERELHTICYIMHQIIQKSRWELSDFGVLNKSSFFRFLPRYLNQLLATIADFRTASLEVQTSYEVIDPRPREFWQYWFAFVSQLEGRKSIQTANHASGSPSENRNQILFRLTEPEDQAAVLTPVMEDQDMIDDGDLNFEIVGNRWGNQFFTPPRNEGWIENAANGGNFRQWDDANNEQEDYE